MKVYIYIYIHIFFIYVHLFSKLKVSLITTDLINYYNYKDHTACLQYK